MQTAAKAAQLAAQKPALDVTTTAQLRDLALTMARLCGWDGKPPASVAVNTAVQTGVVITEEQRMRLIAQRNRPLGLDEEGRKIEAAARRGLKGDAMSPFLCSAGRLLGFASALALDFVSRLVIKRSDSVLNRQPN